MPRIRLTKSTIDGLPTPSSDIVYWDTSCPGFGVKITSKGRKVFIVLYRTGGAGSKLRKYTIGPYGRVTLHQARVAAQKVSRRSWRVATRRRKNERPDGGSLRIGSRTCWTHSLLNVRRRSDRAVRCPGPPSGIRQAVGAGVFTRSASEMWSKPCRPLNSVAHLAPRIRP